MDSISVWSGVTSAAAFIPVVGWGVVIGISVLDIVYGEKFYEFVEKKLGN